MYALACASTVLLGLASRRYSNPISEILGKYPGDALWASMIFFGLGALRPNTSAGRNALFALAICFGIEILKLYQAPWIVAIRQTTLGHLVFGHVFSFENLVAYAIGIGIATLIATVFHLRAGRRK